MPSTYFFFEQLTLKFSVLVRVSLLFFQLAPWSPETDHLKVFVALVLIYTLSVPMLAPFMWYQKSRQFALVGLKPDLEVAPLAPLVKS